jgi:hypothetical protein
MNTLPLLLSVIAVSAVVHVPAQEAGPPQAFQSRTLSGGCGDCVQDPSEAFIDLRAAGPRGLAAFRICTGEPFPVALFVAREPWLLATTMNEWYPDFSADRILILRSNECTRPMLRAQTETWGVPPGAQIPAFVEGVRLSDLRVVDVWANRPRTEVTFGLALAESTETIRSARSAFLVVRGYYWRRPSAAMRANLALARGLIDKHCPDRGYVRLMHSLNEWWGSEPGRRTYPDIYIVHLDKVLAGNTALSNPAPN